jgi:hypothetical protein
MGRDSSTAMRIDFALPKFIDLAFVQLEDAL